jgi:hypothetical protein
MSSDFIIGFRSRINFCYYNNIQYSTEVKPSQLKAIKFIQKKQQQTEYINKTTASGRPKKPLATHYRVRQVRSLRVFGRVGVAMSPRRNRAAGFNPDPANIRARSAPKISLCNA